MQVDVHVLFARLQKGVAPPHCAAEVHWTQRCVDVLHTGVAPLHALESVVLHWRHAPPTQAGAGAVGHSGALPERRFPAHCVHTLPVQMGADAGHCAFAVQLTHVFVAKLQTAVAPVHAAVFPTSHCAHPPVPRHTGLSCGHSNGVVGGPKSPSHPTHVLVAGSHDPVLPVQFPVCVASHWTQPPSLHTGKPAEGHAPMPPGKLDVHGPHPPVTSQTGKPGGHSLLPNIGPHV